MKLGTLFSRWAAPAHQDLKRSPQKTTAGSQTTAPVETATKPTTTAGNILSSVVAPVTSILESPTPEPTTVAQQPDPTTQPPKQQQTTTAAPPSTTSSPQKTTLATSNRPAVSTVQHSATQDPSTSDAVVVMTSTPPPDLGNAATTTAPLQFSTSSSTARPGSGDSGGLEGVHGKQIGTAVGAVAGVAVGFLALILGIYFWRRHRKRRAMERLGPMDDYNRPPSPPLMRSLTRGPTGPRKPIDDDDDDDYLTSMTPQAITPPYEDYGSKPPQLAYFPSGDSDAQEIQFPERAVTPAAAPGRFYNQSNNTERPSTPTNGAIPTYSSMNKYAALSNSTGSQSPKTSQSPVNAVSYPSTSQSPVNGSSYPLSTKPPGNGSSYPAYNNGSYSTPNRAPSNRAGGGYRSHEGYDAGGYV